MRSCIVQTHVSCCMSWIMLDLPTRRWGIPRRCRARGSAAASSERAPPVLRDEGELPAQFGIVPQCDPQRVSRSIGKPFQMPDRSVNGTGQASVGVMVDAVRPPASRPVSAIAGPGSVLMQPDAPAESSAANRPARLDGLCMVRSSSVLNATTATFRRWSPEMVFIDRDESDQLGSPARARVRTGVGGWGVGGR